MIRYGADVALSDTEYAEILIGWGSIAAPDSEGDAVADVSELRRGDR